MLISIFTYGGKHINTNPVRGGYVIRRERGIWKERWWWICLSLLTNIHIECKDFLFTVYITVCHGIFPYFCLLIKKRLNG